MADYSQNKNPLTPAQVFQDVPADHAFKTMTMEAFPHSGQQLASVHPCKHASVMKKFIDRMEEAQIQREAAAGVAEPGAGAGAGGSASTGTATGGGDAKSSVKKRWGLGAAVRKVTGTGSGSGASSASVSVGGGGEKKDDLEGETSGVQVDFYLVIVSRFSRRDTAPPRLHLFFIFSTRPEL